MNPEQSPTFRFIDFNPRRASRGREAVRMEVEPDGQWLWMSRRDLENNIKQFGQCPELIKGRLAYQGKLR